MHEHLQKAQEKQKTWYDQKARELKLSKGEQVLLLLPDSTQKFHHKWQGPFAVKCQIGEVNYEIVMNPQGHTKIFHINLLIKWHPRPSGLHSYFNETEEDGSITDRGNPTQEVKMGKNLTSEQQAQLQEML